MEDTLRAGATTSDTSLKIASLNPCFNGRYSLSNEWVISTFVCTVVLILVLMEDILRGCNNQAPGNLRCVLILVLMEDTLRANGLSNYEETVGS